MSVQEQITSWVRPHIRVLKPYSSARDEFSGKADVFLDANENPIGSASEANFQRYPDPFQWKIKEKLAEIKNVDAQQILLGNGSDECIDLLFRTFCEPGTDHILCFPPTYGMYKVSAEINGIAIKNVPLTRNFQLDIGPAINAIAEGPKLTFLCSPNNPSGNTLKKEEMKQILTASKGLMVVDEAYIDFSPGSSLIHVLDEHPNLVVLQTFSKAWGLAGIRLGMLFAHPLIIHYLNKVKPPYNVNQATQDVAYEALEKVGKKDGMVEEILEQRGKLKEELERIPAVEHVYPSDANFLLAKIKGANQLYQNLIQEKVIVRNRSNVLLCEDCLRITVGTEQENKVLLKKLIELS